MANDCKRWDIPYRRCDKARTMWWLVGASDSQRASLDYLSTDGKQSGYMAINSEGLQGCKLILYLRVTFEFNGCLLVVNSCAHMILHSGKFELETRFVLEFLANSNILNRSFPTNLGSILQRNPVCGWVCKLPRNLSIVWVWLLYRTQVCIAISK